MYILLLLSDPMGTEPTLPLLFLFPFPFFSDSIKAFLYFLGLRGPLRLPLIHVVNWSPTHSTGPQTPFLFCFTDISESVAQIQKDKKKQGALFF